MGGSAPSAPDPYATAAAQTRANRQSIQDSAEVNRYDSFSPHGSTTWDRQTIENPDSVMPDWIANWEGRRGNEAKLNWRRENPAGSNNREEWTQNINLTPTAQRQFDQQNMVSEGLGGFALDRMAQVGDVPQFNLDGITDVNTDFSGQGQQLEQATYDRAQQLMSPGFAEQERRLETKLANQGLPVGSEAYTTEMNRYGRGRDEANLAASLEAVGQGRQEQSRLFGMNQAARQQGISDRLMERNQPINELSAILQGRPAIQSPNVPQTAQYQQSPADISGLIQGTYQQQLANHNQQQQGIMQGGSALAVGAMKAFAACIPEGQVIDTPNGPVAIQALTAGDVVIGFDGKPLRIMQHHAYVENPEPKRFARVIIGDAEVNLCDKHRINDIPSEALAIGDRIGLDHVKSIEWYNGVTRSYDLLTEDKGYQIGGVPVNSMIEEMMRSIR